MYRKEGCPNLVGAPLPAKESKKKEEASNLRDFKVTPLLTVKIFLKTGRSYSHNG